MKVPKSIKNKMHKAAKLSNELGLIMREVDSWFEDRGYKIEDIRCGDGCSLEELEYGEDITEEFCKRIENGEFLEEQKQIKG